MKKTYPFVIFIVRKQRNRKGYVFPSLMLFPPGNLVHGCVCSTAGLLLFTWCIINTCQLCFMTQSYEVLEGLQHSQD